MGKIGLWSSLIDGSNYMIFMGETWVYLNYLCSCILYKKVSFSFFNTYIGEELNKKAITNQLIGILDISIVYNNRLDSRWDTTDERQSIILIDLYSIFLVLRKRFILLEISQYNEEARKYTPKIFEHYQDNKLPLLLLYLIPNAPMPKIDTNPKEYMSYDDRDVNDEYMNETFSKCEKLYKLISYIIENLV